MESIRIQMPRQERVRVGFFRQIKMQGDCMCPIHANMTLLACGAVCHSKCVTNIPPCTDNQNDSVPPPLPPKEERTSKKGLKHTQQSIKLTHFCYSVHGFWK